MRNNRIKSPRRKKRIIISKKISEIPSRNLKLILKKKLNKKIIKFSKKRMTKIKKILKGKNNKKTLMKNKRIRI